MNLICPGLQQYVDLSTRIAAKRGIVGIGEHLEFTDAVNRWRHRKAIQLRIVIENAIQKKIVRVFAGAIHIENEISTG